MPTTGRLVGRDVDCQFASLCNDCTVVCLYVCTALSIHRMCVLSSYRMLDSNDLKGAFHGFLCSSPNDSYEKLVKDWPVVGRPTFQEDTAYYL